MNLPKAKGYGKISCWSSCKKQSRCQSVERPAMSVRPSAHFRCSLSSPAFILYTRFGAFINFSFGPICVNFSQGHKESSAFQAPYNITAFTSTSLRLSFRLSLRLSLGFRSGFHSGKTLIRCRGCASAILRRFVILFHLVYYSEPIGKLRTYRTKSGFPPPVRIIYKVYAAP